jgi:peptide/nickel transport system substrate-binding protein
MRKYYWYISTFIRKHGVVVLASIVIAIVVFSLSLPLLIKILELKKHSYIGVVGRASLNDLPANIEQEVSSGLTKVQPDGSVIPDLAERWNTEDNGKTYRFLIKKGVFWQDGKEVTAEDINYNFDKVQTIKTENEVVFKLPDPFVPFPTTVSRPVFRTIQEPYFFFFKRDRLIGTGKYQVTDYKQHGQYLTELTLNSDEERKTYRFYLTEEDAIDGFKRGEVDNLEDFSSPGSLKNWSTIDVQQIIDPQTYLGIFFNTSSGIFSSNEVRQALNYSLHKPTDETRAVGPISSTSWAFSNVGKTYDFDEARAIDRILAALPDITGYPGDPLHFDLTTTQTFSPEADQIKKEWEEFGQKAVDACNRSSDIKDKSGCAKLKIEVNVKINNFPDTGNYETLLIGEQSPSDPDQYEFWHSQLSTNFTQYKNARIDSYLEKGRQTEDVKKRFEIYQNFQQFFSEDAPVIFIRHLYKYDIHRKGK